MTKTGVRAETIRALWRRGALTCVLREIWAEEVIDAPIAEWIKAANQKLKDWIETKREETDLGRCAALVHLQLVAMHKQCAADTLHEHGWIVRKDDYRFYLNREAIERELRSCRDPFGAALLLTEISIFFYRILCVAEGMAALEFSREFAKRVEFVGVDEVDMALLEASWALSHARLARRPVAENDIKRSGNKDAIHRSLVEAALKMRRAYRDDDRSPTGGINLALAMILDLQACLSWELGAIDEARRLVYESIALLSAQDDVDEIRLGVAMKTAATVEAAQSDTGFTVAMMWSAKSLDLFRRYRHPFAWRAAHQRAQSYVKANRLEDAERVLEEVHENLRWSVPTEDSIERDYASAEMNLTRAWIKQRELLGPGMVSGLRTISPKASDEQCLLKAWKSCANEICKAGNNIPLRLRAEGLFQLGIADICAGDEDVGHSNVHEALKIAQANGRTATEAACCFALAESHARRDAEPLVAQSHWQRGNQLLARVRSSFLSEWAVRLAADFRWRRPLVSLDGRWDEVEEQVLKMYVEHQMRRAQYDVVLAQPASGMSKSHFYELCSRFGIPTQQVLRAKAPRGTQEPARRATGKRSAGGRRASSKRVRGKS